MRELKHERFRVCKTANMYFNEPVSAVVETFSMEVVNTESDNTEGWKCCKRPA